MMRFSLSFSTFYFLALPRLAASFGNLREYNYEYNYNSPRETCETLDARWSEAQLENFEFPCFGVGESDPCHSKDEQITECKEAGCSWYEEYGWCNPHYCGYEKNIEGCHDSYNAGRCYFNHDSEPSCSSIQTSCNAHHEAVECRTAGCSWYMGGSQEWTKHDGYCVDFYCEANYDMAICEDAGCVWVEAQSSSPCKSECFLAKTIETCHDPSLNYADKCFFDYSYNTCRAAISSCSVIHEASECQGAGCSWYTGNKGDEPHGGYCLGFYCGHYSNNEMICKDEAECVWDETATISNIHGRLPDGLCVAA